MREATNWSMAARSSASKLAFQGALVVQMANLSLKYGRRMRWNGGQAV